MRRATLAVALVRRRLHSGTPAFAPVRPASFLRELRLGRPVGLIPLAALLVELRLGKPVGFFPITAVLRELRLRKSQYRLTACQEAGFTAR